MKNSASKQQGKIIDWNDDKGFGFVDTKSGARAFVHIKAFTSRGRRPVNGEVVIYDLLRESNNRYKAENIKFANDNRSVKKTRKSKNNSILGTVFTTVFCIVVAGAVLIGEWPSIIAAVYLLMSVVTFIAYAIDKSAAQDGRWRTKERTLHLFALMGGWPGAYFAQKIVRHKSNKAKFKTFYWLTVMLNIGLLFCLLSEKGERFLDSAILLFDHL